MASLTTTGVAYSGSVATVAAGDRVRGPVALIDETQMWVAIRWRANWAHTSKTGWHAWFDWADSGTARHWIRFDGDTDSFTAIRNAGSELAASQATTFALDDDRTVIGAWTSAVVKLSYQGAAFTSTAATSIPTISATTFDIGGNFNNTTLADVDFYWVAMGTGTLSDANAATIHGFGNTDTAWGSFPGTITMLWYCDDDTYLDAAPTTATPPRPQIILQAAKRAAVY